MFKIDTGADVSIISLSEFKALHPKPQIKKSIAILRGPGGVIANEVEFTAPVIRNAQSHSFRCFVVDAETDNLLSREAATRLALVQRLHSVQNNASDPLFSELDSHPVRCKPVHITLNEDAQPYSLSTARRVPFPLMSKVKEELSRLQKAGVIEVISEPTDWCAPIVPVLKKNGTVRICNDYKQLNKAVKRERYVLPTLEDILHKLSGAKVFSRLDATSGFFQLPLDDESLKLTTFITPFGRYFYRRLPQGITSAPEIFQRTVESMLCDQPHAVCFFDNILVLSDNDSDHKKHLEDTKNKLRSYGLKLNPQKCEFQKKELEFLGYVISGEGIRIHPGKIEVIVKMSNPENVQELRRFVGMVNFLGRHLPNLSTIMQLLTELLEKDKAWGWGPNQEDAVSKIKELLTSAPTLAFYDPVKPTIVTADASSYGIGGTLLQEQKDGSTRPVAYCSRMLTPTERRYAQIEKECLAAVWCCGKFDRYLIGLDQIELHSSDRSQTACPTNQLKRFV